MLLVLLHLFNAVKNLLEQRMVLLKTGQLRDGFFEGYWT